MRVLAILLLSGSPLVSFSQNVEIQRALIQRDQQSAEFARRGLENLHSNQLRDAGRPLSADPVISRELLPYERQQMARDREMFPPLSEPAKLKPAEKPLPLPGGPQHLVEPIAAPSIGG